MEYGDIGDLQNVLYTLKKPFRATQVHAVAAQVLCGLVFLHRQHIVHGDIKPSNLVLLSNGVVKIIDFGVSYRLDATKTDFLPLSMQPGTTSFMAPEFFQINPSQGLNYRNRKYPPRKEIRYNTKVDIWALGCTLLNLLFLRPPFSKPCSELQAKGILHEMFVRRIPQEKVEQTFLQAYLLNARVENNSGPMEKAQQR